MTGKNTKDKWARLSEPPDLRSHDQDMPPAQEISSDQSAILVGRKPQRITKNGH